MFERRLSPTLGLALMRRSDGTTRDKEESMSMRQDSVTTTDEHAAPRQAWDAIAEGYDRYVAPRRSSWPTRRSRWQVSDPASGSLTSLRGQGA
jgi:hypothetical protein